MTEEAPAWVPAAPPVTGEAPPDPDSPPGESGPGEVPHAASRKSKSEIARKLGALFIFILVLAG
jgi:hypothetical protein